MGEKVTTLLMEQDDILSYMFTLLAQKKTFINACQLIEDMLQSKKILLDLNNISKYSFISISTVLLILNISTH